MSVYLRCASLLFWLCFSTALMANWQWQNPLPQGNPLDTVWGTASNNVFAVGINGTIIHYDGIAWNIMPSNTANTLHGVWGTASNNIFAVGDGGTILHYDGTTWNTMNSGTTINLFGVWGTTNNDVFTVGDNGTILHYNGSNWTPMISGIPDPLRSIWGSASNDVFVVGFGGKIVHYNGSNWTPMNSGTSNNLNNVWGSASNDVFAVGSGGAISHYNGTAWNIVPIGISQNLFGVWGTAGNNVFVVGDAGLFARYDGATWSSSTTGTPDNLRNIWGTTSNDLFAIGGINILHYNGTVWSNMTTNVTPPSTLLTGAWGSNNNDVFAVGGNGTIVHYNGSNWSAMASGTTNVLQKVWGSNIPTLPGVFVVGSSGTILRYDGSNWNTMTSNTANQLSGVWGTSNNDVFAVGDLGTILHYDGSNWVSMTSNTLNPLNAVWGNANNDIFAVGNSGTVVHYDGSNWSTLTNVTGQNLRNVWGSSATDVFAVGDGGTILHYNGSNWTAVNSGTTVNLIGIWGNASNNVFVAGLNGTVLHYDGTNWTSIPTGTTNNFNAVWGSPNGAVFVVGLNGAILQSVANLPPAATAPIITGTATVGQLLTANYTYNDVDGDTQGASLLQWYLADDNACVVNKTVISTTQVYTLTATNKGKYICFTITPVAQIGASPGLTVQSPTIGPVLDVPIAPSNLIATVISPTQIDLTWTDNSIDETSFKIERPANTFLATTAANTISYSDSNLTCGTTYTYAVKATNITGDSLATTASATTQACLVPPPNAPSNLIAAAISPTQINLTWTDNSTDETGFKIERPIGTLINITLSNTINYSDNGLTCNTTYTYLIKATNTNGDSSPLTTSATTLPCAVIAPPPPITPITLPPITYPPSLPSNLTAGSTVSGTYSAGGKTLNGITIMPNSSLSDAVLSGNISNSGWLSQVTVLPDAIVTGGILTGTVVNQGTLKDIEFRGLSLTGGVLAGNIRNTSAIDGIIQDVKLASNAHLSGGLLAGKIEGDANNPALLENVTVKTNSQLSNAIITETAKVADTVVIDNVQARFDHLNLPIKTIPYLGRGATWIERNQTKVLEITDNPSALAGGIIINDAKVATPAVTITSSDSVRLLGVGFQVPPEHQGQQADIMVMAYRTHTPSACDGTRRVRAGGGGQEEESYQIVMWDEKPQAWNGEFSQNVDTHQVTLSETTVLLDYNVVFPEPVDYVQGTRKLRADSSDKWRVTFGYRIHNVDGSYSVVSSKTSLHINVKPAATSMPLLGVGVGIDNTGKTVTTCAAFAGGIVVDDAPLVQTGEMKASQRLKIVGSIQVDIAHLAQKAETVVAAAYKPQGNDTEYFFMLSGNKVESWDLTSPLPKAIADLKPASLLTLAAIYQEVLYEGKVLPGQLRIFFGYRLLNGTVIYAPQTLNVTVK